MLNQDFWTSTFWIRIKEFPFFSFFKSLYSISLFFKHSFLSVVYRFYISIRIHQLKNTTHHKTENFIISLTSFPERIKNIHYTLCSLLLQKNKPEKIILVLSEQEFPNKEQDLPPKVLQIINYGIYILWVKENIRSYKKYFYTSKLYPNKINITVDDDIIYDKKMTEKLLRSYKKFPFAISALCTNKLITQAGIIQNFNDAIQCYDTQILQPRYDLVAIGFAGILYPPSILPEESYDLSRINRCAPLADDIWLKFTALLNNIPVVCADKYRDPIFSAIMQKNALSKRNCQQDYNNIQMKNVIKEFSYLNFGDIINQKWESCH